MVRISLRSLLVLVTLVAVAIVSLVYASETWQAFVGAIAMIVFFVAVVMAVVDRGERQAFAIGVALVMSSYGVIVLNGPVSMVPNGRSQNLELDPWSGRLPTTMLLRYVHMAVNHSYWVDSSGKELPDYDPSQNKGTGLGGGNRFGGPMYREVPPREMFMPIGHMWWAILLGLLGGWFARFVYLRRVRVRDSLAAGRS
jgi:hypothetical protein